MDVLEDRFWNQGAISVTIQDASDSPIYEPLPGELPVWKQVVMTGLFGIEVNPDEIVALFEEEGFEVVGINRLKDRVWEREWLKQFEPMQFGDHVWVCPTGFEKPTGIVVQIDPGLAFGTGTHETTRLCLEYLDGLDVTDWKVIDYGCGSGVLAITAALKSAKSVVAIDNDPQALTAAKENAKRNDVNLQVSMPGLKLDPANLVLANILARPLLELRSKLLQATKEGGLLILSGIMSSQKESIVASYKTGAKLIDQAELNGWVRLVWQC